MIEGFEMKLISWRNTKTGETRPITELSTDRLYKWLSDPRIDPTSERTMEDLIEGVRIELLRREKGWAI